MYAEISRFYDTIRDAILTCAQKSTWVGLIYRTENLCYNVNSCHQKTIGLSGSALMVEKSTRFSTSSSISPKTATLSPRTMYKSENLLFHSLSRTEYSLKAVIQIKLIVWSKPFSVPTNVYERPRTLPQCHLQTMINHKCSNSFISHRFATL